MDRRGCWLRLVVCFDTSGGTWTMLSVLGTSIKKQPLEPAGSSMSQSVSLSKGTVLETLPCCWNSMRQPSACRSTTYLMPSRVMAAVP